MGTGHCHCGAVRYEFEGEPKSTGSKAPWYEIRDSLPQYERGRDGA